MGRVVLKLTERAIEFLPLERSYSLAEKLGDLSYFFLMGYRKKILNNLIFALGKEKKKRELKKVARKVSRNFSKGFFEMLYSANSSWEKINAKISLEGKEKLDSALAKGKGVIAVSAHLGSFALMGMKMAQEGYPFYTVIKDPSDPKLARIFQRYRERQGQNSIPLKPKNLCLKKILEVLRNNGIVCLIVDEHKRHRGGMIVDFFGKPAATTLGPAILSLRTESPILPLFIVRQPDNTHKVVIEKELEFFQSSDKKDQLKTITATISQVIESWIRDYPSQWPWFNRRWGFLPDNKTSKESTPKGRGLDSPLKGAAK